MLILFFLKGNIFLQNSSLCCEKRAMIEFHVECQATSYCYRLFLTQMAEGLKIRGGRQQKKGISNPHFDNRERNFRF